MRPPTTPDACRRSSCRPTASPAIHASRSRVPSRRSPGAATSMPRSTAILDAGMAALRPVMGAIFISDPDRPGLQLVGIGRPGRAVGRPAGRRGRRPGPPVPRRRRRPVSRPSIARRRWPTAPTFVGAYLPLIVSSRGLDVPLGSIGFGWPAPRVLDAAERETLTALAGLAAVAVDRARLASTAAERSEWFERMAHTDPLTGLANERTVGRILELELARAGRQGGEVSFAMFDIDDFQATNRDERQRGRRRRPAPRRRGPRRVGPAGRHRRADRRRRVRPGRARLGRHDRRATRPRRDRGAARRSAAARSRSRRAWPASRSMAPIPTP